MVICLELTDSRAYRRITALDVTWVSDDRRGVYTDSGMATATSGSHVISPGGALRERPYMLLACKDKSRLMFRSYVVFQLDRGGVLPLLKPPQSVRLALLVVIMILSRPCGGLGPACIAHDNTTSWASTATRIIVVLETAGSHASLFLSTLLSHTVRLLDCRARSAA